MCVDDHSLRQGLSQTWNSLMWLPLLASLLWGSPSLLPEAEITGSCYAAPGIPMGF